MIHPTTQAILDDLANNKSRGIVAATYTHCYPRQFVSAAFRIAKQRGIIVQNGTSCVGNPIYQRPLKLTTGGI